jgi:hypothetical protein
MPYSRVIKEVSDVITSAQFILNRNGSQEVLQLLLHTTYMEIIVWYTLLVANLTCENIV